MLSEAYLIQLKKTKSINVRQHTNQTGIVIKYLAIKVKKMSLKFKGLYYACCHPVLSSFNPVYLRK